MGVGVLCWGLLILGGDHMPSKAINKRLVGESSGIRLSGRGPEYRVREAKRLVGLGV